MTVKSVAKKYYLQPGKMVYDALVDKMTLQGGKEVFNDSAHGDLHYALVLGCLTWTLRYSVCDADNGRCRVTLEIEEDLEASGTDEAEREYLDGMMYSQFALLDSLLSIDGYLRVSYSERRRV